MRILALNPPDDDKVVQYRGADGEGFLQSDDYGDYPPIGLLYVVSHLEAHAPRHEVTFRDCIVERVGHDRFRREVLEPAAPDLVALTGFTIGLADVVRVCRQVKEWNPGCTVVLGGNHAIAYPRESAALPDLDYVVVGEGEHAFTGLVEALDRGEDPAAIPGVYARGGLPREPAAGEAPHRDKRFLAHVGVEAAYVEDLDALPIPDRRHIHHLDYCSVLGVTRKMATMITSRGCPYKCVFCDVPIKSYRMRDADLVAEEMAVAAGLGYEDVHFYDDLFNITEQRVVELCDAMDRRGVDLSWSFRGRAASTSRAMLARARRSGLRMVSVGVETNTDAGLKELRKATKVEQIERFFGWCRELGLTTVADYMIGLPFERTGADIQASIDFVKRLEPDYVQFSILRLYPHTEVYERAVARGIVEPGRWQAFALDPTPDFDEDMWTEHFSAAELAAWQRRAYKQFYLRPGYVWRSLRRTVSLYELGQKIAGALKILRARVSAARPGRTPGGAIASPS